MMLILHTAPAAFAINAGLVVTAAPEYPAAQGEGLGFTGSLAPWVYSALGAKGGLYLSGKLSLSYDGAALSRPLLAELERCEFSILPVPSLYLAFGRQRYRDSAGMVASGFFDGFSGALSLRRLRLSLGAFYTGLLYKKSAEIVMTEEDLHRYNLSLSYDEMETYFASRRLFFPLTVEFPDLGPRTSLNVSLLAQADLNGAQALNTQYLETRVGFEPHPSLRLSLTGLLGLMETAGADPALSVAAQAEADWDLPGALADMLSLQVRMGSGVTQGALGPFTPLSGIAQGMILTPKLPGLILGRLSYTGRFHPTLAIMADLRYYIRIDRESFKDTELDAASRSPLLGGEAYGSLVWAPQSAIRLSAGGGVFLPGPAFLAGTGARWKANAALTLSF
jgi:hypothetical protein